MHWHEGDISDAVNKVNKADKYLIVFIRDESSSSSVYNSIFEKSEQMHTLLTDCVCLNLLKEGQECRQFTDVYPVTDVPCIYVISHLGQVMDIIKDEIDEEMLTCRLNKIVSVNSEVIRSVENDSQSVTSTVAGGEVENKIIDEKMIEVRQKLAEKHRLKKEEEKAKEIEEELNRRELGKKLVELKKFQKDQEEKEIKDEIKRTRQEDKAARDKVLRQIEEDKQERKKKFSNQVTTPEVTINDQPVTVEVRNREFTNYSTARLQFRFPDGSSTNKMFNCDDKFVIVRQFVSDHVRQYMNSREFEIKQFFPKKTLSVEDNILTLKELQLVPSASLAVIFIEKPNTSSQITSFSSLLFSPINSILMMFLSMFQWIKASIFGTTESSTGTTESSTGTTESSTGNTTAVSGRGASLTTWEERHQRLMAVESRSIKKDGNLAQFSDTTKKKDEKDDATWNGNSTQQM